MIATIKEVPGPTTETMHPLREKFSYEPPYEEKVRWHPKPRVRLSADQYKVLTKGDDLKKQETFAELTSQLGQAKRKAEEFTWGTRVTNYDPNRPLREKFSYEPPYEEKASTTASPPGAQITRWGTRVEPYLRDIRETPTARIRKEISETETAIASGRLGVSSRRETERHPEGLRAEEAKAREKELSGANKTAVVIPFKEEALSRNPRRPIWDKLNDPGEIAVLQRRDFLEKLRERAERGKAEQEAILAWDAGQKLRAERRQRILKEQQRLEEQQRQQEVKPGFRSRVTNFFKERTEKIIDFLSQPNKGVKRLREFETQSNLELINRLERAGSKLRGASGFLRGIKTAFNYLNNTNVSLRLVPRPETKQKQPKPSRASGVPAPKPPGAL